MSEVEDLWGEFDLIFTNDEPIIKSKPEGKLLYTLNKSDYVDSSHILDSPEKITTLEIFQKDND